MWKNYLKKLKSANGRNLAEYDQKLAKDGESHKECTHQVWSQCQK